MEWEVGAGRCKFLYIKWLTNKVLLCNTKNYIQYLMINHDENLKKNVYIYMHD